jgi:hypothetical protein
MLILKVMHNININIMNIIKRDVVAVAVVMKKLMDLLHVNAAIFLKAKVKEFLFSL